MAPDGDLSAYIDSPTVKEVMITFGVKGVKGLSPSEGAIANMYARREAFADELVAVAVAYPLRANTTHNDWRTVSLMYQW